MERLVAFRWWGDSQFTNEQPDTVSVEPMALSKVLQIYVFSSSQERIAKLQVLSLPFSQRNLPIPES
ncbi:hypothetical protein AUC71_16675 [Methyloceanibacter marginalis]|jgi:hypothetical protein|uniref:Uncharacterized protein n=1 Tax=Methyloceanibacter marginalis TaxID=1774971 RepID=A0A1E3W8S5_9HYPH|nr:hypothetical protein AUC71_16675 [Methyloceanibacter marginalis]